MARTSLLRSKSEPIPDNGIARGCGAVRIERGLNKTAVEEEPTAYPHPFKNTSGYDEFDELDLPRLLLELRMCAMSNEIREKKCWWEKINNEEIVGKWKKEVLDAEKEVQWQQRLSEKMVDYVLQELKGYAALRDAGTGVELGCWERVWRSTSLISPDLRADLLKAVALLESTGEPDWHPGSGGLVRDLVHPSLYPIIYNQTLFWDDDTKVFKPIPPPDANSSSTHLSDQFCWLPSDFAVSETGTVSLLSPYINNLNPEAYASVYPVVSRLVQAAIPLWERVLSDLRAPLSPYRFQQDGSSYNIGGCYGGYVKSVECIWEGGEAPYPDSEDEELFEDDTEAWYDSKQDAQRLPEPLDGYDGALERAVKKTVSLAGSTLQVIVKLANIELTPEKPEYAGGTWHVEGMENEHIVSTFIYYYDESNITRSQLSFRTGTCQPLYHGQNDSYCMEHLYGMSRDSPCVQPRGTVSTTQGLCLAFPNIYQHRVSPFSLIDRSRPGHRKIVALFLVDPLMTRTGALKSATQVPPQQIDLYRESMIQDCPLFEAMLPVELRDRIFEELKEVGAKMTRAEAEEVRLKFMKERTQDASKWEGDESFFGLRFNMCEH